MRTIGTRQARAVTTSRGSALPVVRTSMHMNQEERGKAVYWTQKWRALRKAVFSVTRTCQRCGIARAKVLDHIIPISIAPHRAFDPSNVQPLCPACHSWKTKEIDAPGGLPTLYRYERQAEADVRSPELKRWADGFISSGLAAEVVGTPAMGGDGKVKRLPDDLSC